MSFVALGTTDRGGSDDTSDTAAVLRGYAGLVVWHVILKALAACKVHELQAAATPCEFNIVSVFGSHLSLHSTPGSLEKTPCRLAINATVSFEFHTSASSSLPRSLTVLLINYDWTEGGQRGLEDG